jgi:hypothetical protein
MHGHIHVKCILSLSGNLKGYSFIEISIDMALFRAINFMTIICTVCTNYFEIFKNINH